jgi:hypothetical protein
MSYSPATFGSLTTTEFKYYTAVTLKHINANKTKGIRVNTSNTQKFSLDDTETESFVYLGSVVSKTGGSKEDTSNRIKKANGVFVQLYPIWRNHNISKKKLKYEYLTRM